MIRKSFIPASRSLMPMPMPEKPAPTMSTSTEMPAALSRLPEGSGMIGQSYTLGIAFGSVTVKEFGGLPERLASFWNHGRRELPGVRNDGPEFQFRAHASCPRSFREARGIIAQSFICADVNEHRWKTRKIGVKRRRERIAWIG